MQFGGTEEAPTSRDLLLWDKPTSVSCWGEVVYLRGPSEDIPAGGRWGKLFFGVSGSISTIIKEKETDDLLPVPVQY